MLDFENDQKLKKKQKQSENGEKIKVIFLDLSQALTGWVSLFTVDKTESIWFSEQTLSLSQSYLCNIFQRKKKKTFSINTRKNMKKLKTVLNTTSWFCKWFNENRMTLNPSKCDYPSLYLLPQSLQ